MAINNHIDVVDTSNESIHSYMYLDDDEMETTQAEGDDEHN